MSAVSLDEYVNALKAESVTRNWDVAVSYNAKKINQKLADRFAKQTSGMVTSLDISFKDRDRKGPYVQYYHIKLGAPLIQFVSTTADPTCNLTIPIVGGYTWTKDDKQEDPKVNIATNKYTLRLNGLMLAAAEGSGIIKDSVVALPDPSIKRTTVTICLDFPTSSNYLNVDLLFPEDDDSAMANGKLLGHIKTKMSESKAGINYELAAVNNDVPVDNVLDLVPSKFIFTTFSPETDPEKLDSAETSLTLLIQTHGSDQAEGDRKNIQAAWITTWTDLKAAPIPLNHTASIVINNSFFMQKYVKPALVALNLSDIKEKALADGGTSFTAKWPSPLKRERVEVKHRDVDINHLPLKPELYTSSVPEKEYDPNQGGEPFTITFGQANGNNRPGTVNLSWSWEFHDTWTGRRWWRKSIADESRRIEWIPVYDTVSGSYKVDFSLNKTFNTPTLDDEKFSISAEITSGDWKAVTTNKSTPNAWDEFCRFFPFVRSYDRTAPRWVSDAVPRPTFTLNLHALRFFMVTNVLFPGEKVISVNTKAGLLFPRDVVIVGDVIDG